MFYNVPCAAGELTSNQVSTHLECFQEVPARVDVSTCYRPIEGVHGGGNTGHRDSAVVRQLKKL